MKKKAAILIVDDDQDVLTTARMILRPHFEQVLTEHSPHQLEKHLKSQNFNVVILDMNFKTGATSGNEGLFWLRRIKEINPEIQVIMNTAYGDINLAVTCMKEGAVDFLVKPWEKEKLLATVNNVVSLSLQNREITKLKEQSQVISTDFSREAGDLIGNSPAIKRVYDLIDKVAATDANVLILGENGTGKELISRAIHEKSHRKNNPFIKVDVGAMTPTLFESELFGHVKGAYTDAREERTGRFELADRGTIFLDEIGNIPLALQSKLLSVLQNRQISKVGSSQLVDIDIRLISATNKPLYELAAKEEFRQDLLYRINTVEILVPPLRERKEDIPILLKHFLTRYSSKYNKPAPAINDQLVKKLQEYHWPGNVRELQHAVERALIMGSKNAEIADFIPLGEKVKSYRKTEILSIEELEKEAIVSAMEKAGGNLTKAATLLGMGRSTLYRKMEKYNL